MRGAFIVRHTNKEVKRLPRTPRVRSSATTWRRPRWEAAARAGSLIDVIPLSSETHMNAVRRIALGVALTGAAAGAVPAIANAQSTCTYSSSAHRLDVTDNSGPFATLRIAYVQGGIEIADGSAPSHFCFTPDTIATVGNTDTVNISSASFGSGDGYMLDESGGPLGPGA